jgi:hypothetical protein
MAGPFESYVSQKYNIPGSSDDSPAYFMRQSLEPAGWSNDATKWAIGNVPMSFGLEEPYEHAKGVYWPATGNAEVQTNMTPASDASETVRHELQHAWDRQRTGAYPTGAEARGAVGWPLQQKSLDFIQSEVDRDPSHGTNFLYEAMGPKGIGLLAPDFRQKYFGNMT